MSEQWSTESTLERIARAQNGDKAALEELTQENTPLVRAVVRRFLGRGAEYEDLFQIGCIGLLKAISGFDDRFGVRFSTYAVPMIQGEIKRFIRDNSTVKMPRSLKERQQRIRWCRQTLSLKLGREPGVQELASELGDTVEEVLEALESMTVTLSLDEPAFNDGTETAGDLLEARPPKVSAEDRMALLQCLDGLEKKEKQVILLRYWHGLTQTKIAAMMGISQVQISRIESRTLEKLRRRLH